MLMRILLTLIFFFISSFLFALNVPSLQGRRIIDAGEMVYAHTEEQVTALLRSHEEATGNQVAVLIISSLEDESLEAYANRVFNTWGLGQAEKNNGVLLLIVRDERRVRIEVGYGLEPELTDLEAKQIIDHEIVPNFRRQEYDRGVVEGVKAILQAIGGVYAPHYETRGPLWGNRPTADNVAIAVVVNLLISLFIFCMAHVRSRLSYLFMIGFLAVWWWGMVPAYGKLAVGLTGWFVLVYAVTRIIVWRRKKWFSWDPTHYGYRRYTWGPGGGGGGSGGFGGGGFGGGGGFSGGGGSSGGGGASGGW